MNRQMIYVKRQALFSFKNVEKYSRLSSAAVVIGALRINTFFLSMSIRLSYWCWCYIKTTVILSVKVADLTFAQQQ